MRRRRFAVLAGALLALATAAFSQSNVTTAQGNRLRVQEKLNRIVIPQLDFKAANIADVMQYLDQLGNSGDSNAAPDDKGVNFVLMLPPGGGVSKPSAVTLSLRNVTLLSALKIITEMAGLKYRIDGHTVIITPLAPK